jgi:esterase/lipase superfamily enzyme
VEYATDRVRLGDVAAGRPIRYGSERGPIDYGQARISIPVHHRRGETERPPSILGIQLRPEDPARDVVYLSAKRLTQAALLAALRPKSADDKAVLLFIHGYNVTFDDAIRRTGQLAYDLRFPGQVMLFSWPSYGKVADYFLDHNNAEWASADLSRLLVDIERSGHVKRVVILAHSMGNQVVSLALQSAIEQAPKLRQMVSNVIMAAPDIDVDLFERSLAPAVLGAAQSVTMYVSSRDKALEASAKFNGHLRAGDTRSGPLVILPMETIDASLVDTDFLGHSYFNTSANILDDLTTIVDMETPAASRPRLLREVNAQEQGYWRMEP